MSGFLGLDRLAAGYRLRSANRVGKGAVVLGRPFISNEGEIVIGRGLHLCSRPVQSHLVAKGDGRIEIGDDVFISYGAAISAESAVIIGDRTRLGPFVVVMDSDFHVAGDRNARAESTPVKIGRDVVVGSRVTVLRGADIGDGARVQGGSVVSGTVAAGAVVGGVPARALVEHGAHEADVPRLVQRVLGLSVLPQSQDGPKEIPVWDSLGTLKLLLALEEAFGVVLGEEAMRSARSVSELERVVERAQRRTPAQRTPA